MIDIPGVYVGRFKTDPNNQPALMTRANVPTYTNDNWANVESTGTFVMRWTLRTGYTEKQLELLKIIRVNPLMSHT